MVIKSESLTFFANANATKKKKTCPKRTVIFKTHFQARHGILY